MKYSFICLILIFAGLFSFSQNTLLLEKIGTSRKFYYHLDDRIKLTTKENHRIFDALTNITDSVISVSNKDFEIPVHDIASVYPQFGFPRRLGKNLCLAGGVFLVIITFNNIINNQQVFPSYGFIVSGACLAGGLVSLSLAQQKCKIGYRWKLKVLDSTLR
jgi:hypothetical protein